MNKIKLNVNIWLDDCADDPCTFSGWKVKSFHRRGALAQPDDVGFDWDDTTESYRPDADLRKKIENGTAYILDYYEHGACWWYLPGEAPNCRWDTSRMAGLLVWDDKEPIGIEDYDECRKYAAAFLEEYNQWVNGNVYGFTVEAATACCECGQDRDANDLVDFDLPSCGGYYGDNMEGLVADLRDMVDEPTNYEVVFSDNFGGYLADECRKVWDQEIIRSRSE